MTTLPVAAGPFPVRAGRPRDDDWIPADNLLEPGSPLLEERLLAFGKRLGTTRAAVALSLLLEAYTGLLASVAFGSLLGAGRAPELAVGNVSVRLESGGVPDALAVHDPTPRAGDRLDRLEGVAASLLDRHLGVLVARLGAVRAGRGRRALWGLVAGGCAAAVVDAVERAGGPPQQARALTEALFALPGSPARGGPGPPCHRRPAGAQAAELLPLVRAAGLRLLRHLPGVERPARGRAGGGTAGRAPNPRLILSSGSRLDRPIRSRPESHSL